MHGAPPRSTLRSGAVVWLATVPGRRSASPRRSRNGGKGGGTRVRADRHGLRTRAGAAARRIRRRRARRSSASTTSGCPAEDLADRNPLDLYGAAVAHWNLAQQRAPGEAKVRVYNPDFEQHGWQSPHTLIEIVSDDMPFIVDSVTMDLTAQGLRHPPGDPPGDAGPPRRGRPDRRRPRTRQRQRGDAIPESILHAEVGREHDRELLDELRRSIEQVLDQVRAAIEDWQAMRAKRSDAGRRARRAPAAGRPGHDRGDQGVPALAGRRQLHVPRLSRVRPDRGRRRHAASRRSTAPASASSAARSSTPPKKLSPKAVAFGREPQILVLTKANSRSPVHRPAYLDYIGVKKFDERRAGRSASGASSGSTRPPPTRRAPARSRSSAARSRACSSAPASRRPATTARRSRRSSSPTRATRCSRWRPSELFNVAIGILGLGERQRLRLFMWRDPLDRFVECLVCIPRDRFNTENRERVGRILLEALGGAGARLDAAAERVAPRARALHHPLRRGAGARLRRGRRSRPGWCRRSGPGPTTCATRCSRSTARRTALKLFKRYERAFPPGYRSDWVARSAVADIARIEELASADEPITSLYRPLEAPEGIVRLKLFSSGGVLLSDVLPTFEHLGAKVADERPYEITPADRAPAWIYDFGLQADAENLERVRDLLHDAFLGVWRGELEDDGLNGLVLGRRPDRPADLDHPRGRQVPAPGRASASRTPTSSARCSRHPDIARLLVELFDARLDPDRARPRRTPSRIAAEIEEAIDAVPSLDEDRILRSFLSGRPRDPAHQRLPGRRRRASRTSYLSFKLDPPRSRVLPLPRPQFEIFVYSPRVEGVHLRGGKVARGGIRWSDRREDFRTEILGLMKAQMVKNALIVPVGAKGGFVVKRPPHEGGREALQAEAHRLLQDVPVGHARHHRQHRRRRGRPARAGGPLRRRRSVPGGGGRQGHGDVLATSPTRSRPTTASGWATRSPRAARRATTTSRWGSPRAARGSRSSATSASSASTSRRPTSPSSASATCPATCSATGCCSRATPS